MDLYTRSIEVILENQTASGAYVASPNFDSYRYCWFRDGAFIAYAMDIVGETESSGAFHDWVSSVIIARAPLIERTIAKVENGEVLTGSDYLHTRYAPDGRPADESTEWPNHQLDGFGTWIWALAQHARQVDRLEPDWLLAAGLLARYLTSLWQLPCYDCWEEFPDQVHTYTLAAIHAGLRAHQRLSGHEHESTIASVASRIEALSGERGYRKHSGRSDVDASLLGLGLPYGVVELDDPRFRSTVAKIVGELGENVGVRRYPTDTYYGGGQWLLLTCWLAWYYLEVGESDKARQALDWVRDQASTDGFLPEQVPNGVEASASYREWVDRWGEIASPLLWSHAMYLICESTRRTSSG